MLSWPVSNKIVAALSAGAGAALAGLVMWALWSVNVATIKADYEAKLVRQAVAMREQFDKDVALSEGVSHEYQTKNAELARSLAKYKRMHGDSCVPVTPAPGRSDDTAAGGEPTGQHGITVGPALEYGANCEQLRLQVIGLQDFINKTWESR